MSTAQKKRWLLRCLVALAIWPAAHHLLVVTLDINPWKLFGWSMYCVPKRWTNIEIVARDRDGASVFDYQQSTVDVSALVQDYIDQRWVYGKALPPDRVARVLFKTFPGFQALDITIFQLSYEGATGYYRNHPTTYSYSAP